MSYFISYFMFMYLIIVPLMVNIFIWKVSSIEMFVLSIEFEYLFSFFYMIMFFYLVIFFICNKFSNNMLMIILEDFYSINILTMLMGYYVNHINWLFN